MYRGQETHPIRVINARYVMNGTNSFFNKVLEIPFGHQRAENEARNTKMYRGQETHPIRVINARYVMNGTNSFLIKFWKPHFQPNIWPPEGRK